MSHSRCVIFYAIILKQFSWRNKDGHIHWCAEINNIVCLHRLRWWRGQRSVIRSFFSTSFSDIRFGVFVGTWWNFHSNHGEILPKTWTTLNVQLPTLASDIGDRIWNREEFRMSAYSLTRQRWRTWFWSWPASDPDSGVSRIHATLRDCPLPASPRSGVHIAHIGMISAL